MGDGDFQRFDIPAKPTMIEGYRAFRSYLERVAEAEGKKLDPVWYADGPGDLPAMYADQPHLLPPSARPDDAPQSSPATGGEHAD